MKGFFSFLLVFVLCLCLLLFVTAMEKDVRKGALIELEQNNMKRIVMENNVDRIVAISLRKGIEESSDIGKVKNQVNQNLFSYLKSRAEISDLFYNKIEKITLKKLNENSAVTIYKTNGIVYGEYVYTSDLYKRENISKKLGEKTKLVFKIPVGYTERVMGIEK
jgi:hypothetical protein